jgi:uncharacterized protein YbjT (DUF2867 family)
MRIAVIGAFGKAGSLIAEEAISRGHDVTAIARRKHDDRFAKLIEKDLMDLTRDDLTGFDAVVDAASAWTPDTFHIHTDGIRPRLTISHGKARTPASISSVARSSSPMQRASATSAIATLPRLLWTSSKTRNT